MTETKDVTAVGSPDSLAVKPTPSEVRYGITKQPPGSCPLIDAAIKAVQEAQDYTGRSDNDTEEGLRDRLWRIELALGKVVGYQNQGLLEDIRANVINVRAWGQAWKDIAKEHAPEDEEYLSANDGGKS